MHGRYTMHAACLRVQRRERVGVGWQRRGVRRASQSLEQLRAGRRRGARLGRLEHLRCLAPRARDHARAQSQPRRLGQGQEQSQGQGQSQG